MDTRKIINQVAQDQVIGHVGDLTIQGDVGENAQINLSEGSLVILGNIKDGAKINLNVSEELRNSFSIAQLSNLTSNVNGMNISSVINNMGGKLQQEVLRLHPVMYQLAIQ